MLRISSPARLRLIPDSDGPSFEAFGCLCRCLLPLRFRSCISMLSPSGSLGAFFFRRGLVSCSTVTVVDSCGYDRSDGLFDRVFDRDFDSRRVGFERVPAARMMYKYQ